MLITVENSRAAEYFAFVAKAAKDRHEAQMTIQELTEADALQCVRYDGTAGRSSDIADRVDAAMARRKKLEDIVRQCTQVMDDALALLYGHDGRGGVARALSMRHADVVCAHYIQLESWRTIAEQLGCSHTYCRMLSLEVMSYLNRNPNLL